jgi:hypothetical protein
VQVLSSLQSAPALQHPVTSRKWQVPPMQMGASQGSVAGQSAVDEQQSSSGVLEQVFKTGSQVSFVQEFPSKQLKFETQHPSASTKAHWLLKQSPTLQGFSWMQSWLCSQ